MTDPILYLSMILGLTGVYVLISSFSDDDDDSNDDGERYIYNLEYVKVGKQLFITSIDFKVEKVVGQSFQIRDFKFVRVKERLGSGVGTYKYSVNN